MRALNRRTFLHVAALGAAASAAVCASATEPAASPVPLDAAQQATSSTPPAAPDGTAVREADWTKKWADLIADATREGRLSLITWGAGGYGRVIERFEQAFPGTKVGQLAESSAAVWLGRVRQQRRAGSYAFDLALVQPDAALMQGRPEGMWAPIRPLLFRPDVLDDGAWRDGVNARFLDGGGDLCFDWEYQVIHAYAVNTDMVRDGEIGSVKDLLGPKWTGRILSSDPRVGFGLLAAASVARSRGRDVVKRLLVDQRPAFSGGGRDLAEALVHGRYPIALGVRPKALQEFRDQGLGHRVRFLDLPDADFVPSTALLYFDRAPHPAAARLFANWILTREGQTLLTSSLPTNSARTDVEPFEPDGVGTAGAAYFDPDHEANHAHIADTRTFISNLLGSRN